MKYQAPNSKLGFGFWFLLLHLVLVTCFLYLFILGCGDLPNTGSSNPTNPTTPTSVSISGTVKNLDANGVTGIKIYLNESPSASTTTGSSGKYSLSSVAAGTYTVVASENATYLSATKEARVATAETTTINFLLYPRIAITGQIINLASSLIAGTVANNGATTAETISISYVFYNTEGYPASSGTAGIGSLASSEGKSFSIMLYPQINSYSYYTATTACEKY